MNLSDWLRGAVRRLRGFRPENELDEELRFHVEQRAEALRREAAARGTELTEAEARRRALVELGGLRQIKEEVRAMRTGVWLETLWQDVRYAVRQLRKNPGFTAVAVLTLALGIGANTAVFSVVYSVMVRSLPYPEPDRLVMIWNSYGGKPADNSPPDYFDRVQQSRTLDRLAAFRPASFNLTSEGEPERLEGAVVTASFFPTLGVSPLHGRVFDEEEDQPGRSDVALLSYGTWRRRFGGEVSALGRSIRLNDRSFIVLGVMPESFSLLFPTVELWTPIAFPPESRRDSERGNENLLVVGRMQRGIPLQQTRAEMAAIAARVLDTVPERRAFLERAEWSGDAVSLHEHYSGDLRPTVLLLFGAVTLVLLIAGANLASLQLVRRAGRERELAVRAALGASRARIVRQLCVESLCLTLAGGAVGILLAGWAVQVFPALDPDASPLLRQVQLNTAVLLFATSLMFLIGISFGLLSSIRRSPRLQDALRAGIRSAATMRITSRRAIVIGEIAMALVLLVVAGLILQSFQRLLQVSPGFATADRLTFHVSLPRSRYGEPERLRQFQADALARLRDLPGVLAAGAVQSLPIAGTGDTSTVRVEGRELQSGEAPLSCEYRMISPGYLRAMGIPRLRGRDFEEADSQDRPGVVLVSEQAAREYWPGLDPLGQRLSFGDRNWREVVGVVGSVRNRGLDLPEREQVYLAHAQNPLRTNYYVLHTRKTPSSLAPTVRAAIRSLDSDLPIYDVRTMEEYLSDSLARRRVSSALLAGFASVALLLAAIGVYGVVSYSVRQSTREIGIRLALGAQPRQLFRWIVGQGMVLVAAGLAFGLAGGMGAARFVRQMLFGVSPGDPAIFLVSALLLTATALLACWVPARRATRVDPSITLRYE